VVTPREPARRGCQLSLRFTAGRVVAREVFEAMEPQGVIADWREPDIIRVAPVPFYNGPEDIGRLVVALRSALGGVRT
jgi:kynureninase